MCTFGLLIVGGMVTTYRVGMAVHDWPTTFGYNMFSYPLDQMLENWGVTVEHSHRMLASCVGILTIVVVLVCARSSGRWSLGWAQLAIAFEVAAVGVVLAQQTIDGFWPAFCVLAMAIALLVSLTRGPFRSVRIVAVLTHFAVIGQGLLGGTRVLENSQDLAFLHGACAQIFYALVGALLVVTSRSWWSLERRACKRAAGLRRTALLALPAVYAQIVFGAWLRHSGRTDALLVHVVFAFATTGLVLALGARLRRTWQDGVDGGHDRAPLLAVRRLVLIALGLQIALGVLALVAIVVVGEGFAGAVTVTEAVTATLHVAIGAVLLAGVCAAVLWSFRIVSTGSEPALAPAAKPQGGTA